MSSRLASKWRRSLALLTVTFCGFSGTLLEAEDGSLLSPAKELPDNGALLESIGGQVAAIFDRCKGAVIRIQAMDHYGSHAGTGFFIDPNGTIYTHYSVGGGSWNLTVEFAAKRYPATCLLADPRSGVALLKIDADAPTPFLPIGRSEDLKVASPLVAVGYPLDHPASPSFGLVGGFDQRIPQTLLATTHVRANVAVQPGEQGAPLLNVKGEVVGILVCRLDFGTTCLVLPIRAAEKVRGNFMRFGEPHPGWIGASVAPAGQGESAGLKISDLDQDAPVAHSGIMDGDVLVQIGATPILSASDLPDASFFLTADETVPIVIRRGDKTMTFEVKAVRPPGMADAIKLPPAGEGMRLSLPRLPLVR